MLTGVEPSYNQITAGFTSHNMLEYYNQITVGFTSHNKQELNLIIISLQSGSLVILTGVEPSYNQITARFTRHNMLEYYN